MGGHEWASDPTAHKPELDGYDVFYCAEHEKSYMVWTGRHLVHVADSMINVVMRSLALVLREQEIEESKA